MKYKVGIVGNGVVGKAQKELFPEAAIYDPYQRIGNKERINQCDIAFICVWAPTDETNETECDLSDVELVVSWCTCPLLILRSTVPPGTTKRLAEKYGKHIVFEPEYLGETINHPYNNLSERKFLILGGEKQDLRVAIELYKEVYTSDIRILTSDSTTVELCKLVTNAWLATKVTFCNDIYDTCEKLGVEYDALRELWLQDHRVTRSHTFVYPDKRGFGGKCLPKDVGFLAKHSDFCRHILETNDWALWLNSLLKEL
jgi:UDPglucose 6-dehydrogenase